jgi:hypothetical protein
MLDVDQEAPAVAEELDPAELGFAVPEVRDPDAAVRQDVGVGTVPEAADSWSSCARPGSFVETASAAPPIRLAATTPSMMPRGRSRTGTTRTMDGLLLGTGGCTQGSGRRVNVRCARGQRRQTMDEAMAPRPGASVG